MRFVSTPNAPAPAGHYAQAVVYRGLVFVAGQLPKRPDGTPLSGAPVEEQMEAALRNAETILKAAGSGLDRVVQLTVFVTDIASWGAVNAACARVFGDHRPARAVVPAGRFAHDLALEIQLVAAASEDQ